jgi:hypothetical protein
MVVGRHLQQFARHAVSGIRQSGTRCALNLFGRTAVSSADLRAVDRDAFATVAVLAMCCAAGPTFSRTSLMARPIQPPITRSGTG